MPSAGLQIGDAIDVGALGRRASDDPPVLRVDLLDEDLDLLADPLLGALRVELLDETRDAVDALGDDL